MRTCIAGNDDRSQQIGKVIGQGLVSRRNKLTRIDERKDDSRKDEHDSSLREINKVDLSEVFLGSEGLAHAEYYQ